MGDLGDVYEGTRNSLLQMLKERPESDLDKSVPATPGWRVRDIVAHLIGDATSLLAAEFPREFFQSFGDPEAIGQLNKWTSTHVEARQGRSLEDLGDEWNSVAPTIVAMMRGERSWPDDLPFFTDRVLITDLGVHQQDIYGAFGIDRDREGPPIKIGVSGYIATMDWRMRGDGVGPLAFEAPGKRWVAGGDDADATVRASRFELFRALSGRRSPEQISAFDWDGDPEPYIPFFYPYGVRTEALVE
jgi:uncharacterized protein (TIGR03083 family)